MGLKDPESSGNLDGSWMKYWMASLDHNHNDSLNTSCRNLSFSGMRGKNTDGFSDVKLK